MRAGVGKRVGSLLAIGCLAIAGCTTATPSGSAAPSTEPGGSAAPSTEPGGSAAPSAAASGGASGAGGESIYYVGLAQPTDAFHGYLYRGALQAGEDLNANVTYIFPDQLTVPNYMQKVDEALLARPAGMVMQGFAEEAVYQDAITKATEQGVVLGWNPAPGTGLRPPTDPFVSRVGSDEASAGKLSGEEMVRRGVTGRVIVANGVPGDATCAARASNEVDAVIAGGGQAEAVEVPQDANQAAEFLTTFLRANADVGGMSVVCGNITALLDAQQNAGRSGLLLSGYDIYPPMIEGIKAGTVAFTIDQQAWWRGYIPVQQVVHAIRYGLIQSNYFLTGPSLVDSANIDQVTALVEAGYR
jgi:simple sugar transport system substrate-binding protein